MKKLIITLVLILMFAVPAIGADTGTQVYYGSWSNSQWPSGNPCVYCGWWSAFAVISTSPEPQEVAITIYTRGDKYEGWIVLESYGVYTTHVPTTMEEFGYDPLLCVGGFAVKIENTPDTYSVFLIHNGSHSYTQ